MGTLQRTLSTYEILELPASLLDNTVLALENDTHATEVWYLSTAYDQGVDVEASSCQDT